PALQRLQRPFGRAQCLCRAIRQSMAVGRSCAIGRLTCRGGLSALPSGGVLDREPGRKRLANLLGDGELRPVAAGAGQAHDYGLYLSDLRKRQSAMKKKTKPIRTSATNCGQI